MFYLKKKFSVSTYLEREDINHWVENEGKNMKQLNVEWSWWVVLVPYLPFFIKLQPLLFLSSLFHILIWYLFFSIFLWILSFYLLRIDGLILKKLFLLSHHIYVTSLFISQMTFVKVDFMSDYHFDFHALGKFKSWPIL